jgi:hypothetical protein
MRPLAWLVVPAVAVLTLWGCSRELPPPVACSDLAQGCRVANAQGALEVRTDASPSALHPFMLTVNAPGARQVHAEFVMQGMQMGLNRYRLGRLASGEWRARVTLPVCISGRRDWLLILDVDDERYALAFTTT